MFNSNRKIAMLCLTMLMLFSTTNTAFAQNTHNQISTKVVASGNETMNKVNEEVSEFHEQALKEAKAKNEKIYTLQDILNASAKELKLSEEQYQTIVSKILDSLKLYDYLLSSSPQQLNMTQEQYDAMVQRISQQKNRVFTIKEITWTEKDQVNKGEPSTGTVQPYLADPGGGGGGGVQGCIDNNGWGYKYFIQSDCDWAWGIYGYCTLDFTSYFMSGSERYCQYGIRNCSPLIGHPYYWHNDGYYSGPTA